MVQNELTHHGVRGQKWGVRRYQNKDGTLTKAGKRRYEKELDTLKKEQQIAKNKQKTAAKLAKLDKLQKDIDDRNDALNGKKDDDEAAKKQYEDAKAKALKSGSASEVLKFKGDLTKQEMEAAWSRIQWEQNMSSTAAKESADKGKKVFDTVEKVTGYANTTLKAWNTIANVYNGLNLNGMLPKFDTNITNGNRKERTSFRDSIKKRAEQEAQRESKRQERAEKRAQKDDEHLTGTVEGLGNSRRTKNNSNRTRSDVVYDTYFTDTTVSDVRNSRQASIGQNYINNMFLLEDKKK